MAKVFIVLLSVLVLLNGMTFLVVVNQGAAPGDGASASEADAAGKKLRGPDPALQKLESLERTIQSVKGSVDRLSSKVDGLQAKVNQVASRPAVAPAAVVEPLPPPSGGVGQRGSPIRRGRVDYSRIAAPEESGVEEAEPAIDETASDEDAVPAEGAPAEPAGEGTVIEEGAEGAGEAVPAEGADGAVVPEEGEGG